MAIHGIVSVRLLEDYTEKVHDIYITQSSGEYSPVNKLPKRVLELNF